MTTTPNDSAVRTVHLVFKTHLDIGFTQLAAEVTRGYLEGFIPAALQLSQQLRNLQHPERFVWTTGAWLIHLALEKAQGAERTQLEEAIVAGDLTWHALPYTMHCEFLSSALFKVGLGYSAELDTRFGRTTTAAKMTDVPGHTRGIVPLLSQAGVQFLHLGVNPASSAPNVPNVFVWQATNGEEIIVAYDKTGYGGTLVLPGSPDALCIVHTYDNLGPPSLEAVQQAFAQTRARFPQAEVKASTLDAFTKTLISVRPNLPVLKAEIGDTWIHGVGSDPLKVSRFRTLSRLFTTWGQNNRQVPVDFGRSLLKVGEHTWGLDVKTHLKDNEHFTPQQLEGVCSRPDFQKMEASWQEQRDYISQALHTLKGTSLEQEAQAALETEIPHSFSRIALRLLEHPLEPLEIGGYTLKFAETGALSELQPLLGSNRKWATPQHVLGLLRYQIFGAEDYDRFYRDYSVNNPAALTEQWARQDFTKPGLETVLKHGKMFLPELKRVWVGVEQLVLELTLPKEACDLGAPAQIEVGITFSANEITWDLVWLKKPASRIAEALWFGFSPPVTNSFAWQLDKLGETISPLEVISHGNRSLHAIDSGIQYSQEGEIWQLKSLDTALVAPGEPALLQFNDTLPDMKKGFYFNLYNNVWGTNFAMWFGEAARFRFVLTDMQDA